MHVNNNTKKECITADTLLVFPICVTGVDKKLPSHRDETTMLSNDSAYGLLWGVNGPCLWQKKIRTWF